MSLYSSCEVSFEIQFISFSIDILFFTIALYRNVLKVKVCKLGAMSKN